MNDSEYYTLGQLHDIPSVDNFYDYGTVQAVESKYPAIGESAEYENPYGNRANFPALRDIDKEESNSEQHQHGFDELSLGGNQRGFQSRNSRVHIAPTQQVQNSYQLENLRYSNLFQSADNRTPQSIMQGANVTNLAGQNDIDYLQRRTSREHSPQKKKPVNSYSQPRDFLREERDVRSQLGHHHPEPHLLVNDGNN